MGYDMLTGNRLPLFIRLLVSLSFCQSVCLSVMLSVCLSLCLFMADTTNDWLPWPVCRHHTVIPRRDGGPSTRSRTNVRAILVNKWYQARLCDGTTVIHISILSHAQWCVPWKMTEEHSFGSELMEIIFNLLRLNSKTRTSKVLIRDLLFADDCALLAHTVDDIQAITNAFARSARRFGLTISMKKTDVIYQPKPGADWTAPSILPSQSTTTHWKSLISSHTWAARYHRMHGLTTRSRHGLAKRAGRSANSPSTSGANAECG